MHTDYCNSVLYGIHDNLPQMKAVQKQHCRLFLVLGDDHILPIFYELHWLPVQSRQVHISTADDDIV